MLRAALAELPSRTSWNTRFQELVAYKREHGHCSVAKADGALGRWVARQRELAKKNVLAADRRARLEALGFVWNTNDEAWDTRYRQLLEWARERGHACVPIADGDLGLWVAKQRQMNRKGKLASERRALLDDADFTWDTPSADWNEKFGELLRYKDRYGDCRVPFNSPDGLGWWVNTQRQARRKGKLSRERQDRLDAIGFIWNPQQTARAATKRRIDDRPTPAAASTLVAAAVSGLPTTRMTKRHHSFAGYDSSATSFCADQASSPATSDADPGSFGSAPLVPVAQRPSPVSHSSAVPSRHHLFDRSSVPVSRRAASFGMFTPPCPSPSASPTFLSGTSTPTGDGGGGSSGALSIARLISFPIDISSSPTPSPSHSMAPLPRLPPLQFPNPSNSHSLAPTAQQAPIAPSAVAHSRIDNAAASEQQQLYGPRGQQMQNRPEHQQHGPSSRGPMAPSAARSPGAVQVLPPVNTLDMAVRGGSPRRRRRSPFPDSRRAISFNELLDSAFTPGTAPPEPGTSRGNAREGMPGSSQHGQPCNASAVPSGSADQASSSQSSALLHPLADLAALAVSTNSPSSQPRIECRLPSIQELCAPGAPGSSLAGQSSSSAFLRRLNKFG